MRVLLVSVSIVSLALSACSSAERAAEPTNATLQADLLRAPLADTSGKPLVIADELRDGKKVALVFWQEWCPSCRAEAPALVAASEERKDLEIIGVVSGPDDAVDGMALERAIRELGLPYRTVRDRDLALTRALEVKGTPTIVVLDAQGHILYRGHRVPDWDALL